MSVATPIPIPAPRRQLAHRTSGGLEITLYWHTVQGCLSVEVHQPATQETIAFAVSRKHALDAFHHPFAHMAQRWR